MPSAIDPSMPIFGSPTTESVRANFATAQSEISALQTAVACPAITLISPGNVTIPPGTARVYVAAPGGPVTLTLPANDCLVADRGPFAGTYPITCAAPLGTTINGNPDLVIFEDWGAASFFWDGANFGVAP